MKENVAFLLAFALIVVLTACDQGPGPVQPTALPQATTTALSSGPTSPGVVRGTASVASTPTALAVAATTTRETGCTPTRGELAQLLEKNPPVRSSVGTGHILKGIIRSSRDCSPIVGAKIIVWLANSEGIYTPDQEATLYTDSSGAYRFESNFPGEYAGTPPHIHMWVTADGNQPLITTYPVPSGRTEGVYDLVLAPEEVKEPTPAVTPIPPTKPASTPTSSEPVSCAPTRPDGEGPFYKPDAPERTSVGKGHILKGIVKSTRDCAAIPGAKIEFWQVNSNGQYDDEHRATMHSEASGAYSFESNFPPAYENRPPHIHLRVSAQGYHTLITQYYPTDGETEGTFDLVIAPDER